MRSYDTSEKLAIVYISQKLTPDKTFLKNSDNKGLGFVSQKTIAKTNHDPTLLHNFLTGYYNALLESQLYEKLLSTKVSFYNFFS